MSTSTLMNFYLPTRTKSKLDFIANYRQRTRSSIIKNLIENWVREEFELVSKDQKFDEMIAASTPVVRTDKKSNSMRWEDSY
jgi:predicted transcriptional regulator